MFQSVKLLKHHIDAQKVEHFQFHIFDLGSIQLTQLTQFISTPALCRKLYRDHYTHFLDWKTEAFNALTDAL
jgi:hypothetical protein